MALPALAAPTKCLPAVTGLTGFAALPAPPPRPLAQARCSCSSTSNFARLFFIPSGAPPCRGPGLYSALALLSNKSPSPSPAPPLPRLGHPHRSLLRPASAQLNDQSPPPPLPSSPPPLLYPGVYGPWSVDSADVREVRSFSQPAHLMIMHCIPTLLPFPPAPHFVFSFFVYPSTLSSPAMLKLFCCVLAGGALSRRISDRGLNLHCRYQPPISPASELEGLFAQERERKQAWDLSKPSLNSAILE